ncbi:MAG: hypothetical protein RLZZ187_3733, partial [Pseudomonadota bacterium]
MVAADAKMTHYGIVLYCFFVIAAITAPA